jgi:hypothetical protein
MVFWPYFFVILDLLKINYQLSVIDVPLGTYLSEPRENSTQTEAKLRPIYCFFLSDLVRAVICKLST